MTTTTMEGNEMNQQTTSRIVTESWRFVPGSGGRYSVSNHGNVIYVGYMKAPINIKDKYYKKRPPIIAKDDRFVQKRLTRTGYHHVYILKNHKKAYCFVHSLVARAFLKKPKQTNQINHKDGNKLNNHISNLEWCNGRENTTHYRMSINIFIGAHKQKGKFTSSIRNKGVECYLGMYNSKEEAHIAYLMAVILYKCENKYLQY